ncbi:MAG TPA: hypothetical protein VLN25_11855 [Burkholderiaceae bacterium]|nr:hypothetical protein [Burkholderiaceae bacterium]
MQVVEMSHTPTLEAEVRLNEVERMVHQTARSAAKLVRQSMHEAITAATLVRSSMKEAFGAIVRAMRNIAKEVAVARQAVMPVATTMKRPVRKAGARLAA